MDSLTSQLPAIVATGAGGGVGIGVGFYMLTWLFNWLGGRLDKREASVEVGRAQVDAAVQTLIAHLQQQITALTETNARLATRVDAVEAELEHCRHERAADQEELARLRGAVMGLGDARQQAATIVASERVVDRAVAKIVGGTEARK